MGHFYFSFLIVGANINSHVIHYINGKRKREKERWKKFFPSIVVDVEAEDDSVAYLGRVKVKATIQLLSLAVAVKKTSFTRYSYPLVHRDGCERVWMILDLSQIPLVIILRLFGWRWAYTTLTSSMSVSSTMVWPYGPTAGFWTLS
ncbi:hypothetical protein YC2023_097725 [Brassica napus]